MINTIIITAVIVLIIVLIILVITLNSKVNELKLRVQDFMAGMDGASLEEAFSDKFSRIDELEERDEILAARIKDIYKRLRSTYRKTGLVKYDAYSEAGGKFSFALTMLNEKDNGFLLNVMNGKDGGYSFIKNIVAGEPDSPLGKEEEQSLNMALSEKQSRSKGKNR